MDKIWFVCPPQSCSFTELSPSGVPVGLSGYGYIDLPVEQSVWLCNTAQGIAQEGNVIA